MFEENKLQKKTSFSSKFLKKLPKQEIFTSKMHYFLQKKNVIFWQFTTLFFIILTKFIHAQGAKFQIFRNI